MCLEVSLDMCCAARSSVCPNQRASLSCSSGPLPQSPYLERARAQPYVRSARLAAHDSARLRLLALCAPTCIRHACTQRMRAPARTHARARTRALRLQHKVWVKPSAELSFLYGNHVRSPPRPPPMEIAEALRSRFT